MRSYAGRSNDGKGHAPRSRAAKTRETRDRMLAGAYEVFVTRGYAGATMPAVALAAGVHVQTLHYTFHTKAQLLVDVIQAFADDGDPTPVMDRAWMREALAVTSAPRTLALVVEHGTEIYRRIAPLQPAIQAATVVESTVNGYVQSVAAARRGAMRLMVSALAVAGKLASTLEVDPATDILHALHSHETYLALVVGARWTVPRYKAWLYQLLCQQLLAGASPKAVRDAAQSTSFRDHVLSI